MTRRKPGRPSQGLSETRAEFRLSKDLAKEVKKAAKVDGVTKAQWWRDAAERELFRRLGFKGP